MNTEPIKLCPKCQAPIPAEAPQGLCPKCLLAAASIGTEAGQAADPTVQPSLESIANAFPQLEILEFIGQGGMGLVFKARQPKLDRFVALKLLPQKPGADPAFHERFNREARVLARLSHPNIVAVHDFGQAGPFFYLLMEFVDGVNLRQAMRAGRFTPGQALALVPKICDALQYAHEEGILHRDIKPENLLMDTRGRVKIADFGIAKLLGETKDITLTASGSTIGTPHYMAPEQLERPHDVDQRADIYSLGVVFYEMLTGELPIGRFAAPSEKSTVDPRVDQVVLRALEKERERRFQSAGDVRTQVERITSDPGGARQGAAAKPSGASEKGGGALGQTRPTGVLGWSLEALAGAALVGFSLLAFLVVMLPGRGIDSREVALLVVLLGLPALGGTVLSTRALRQFQTGTNRLRGGRLSLVAAMAWPLLLLDIVCFTVPVLFADSIQWHLFHARSGPLTDLPRVIMALVILGLNVLVLKRWIKDWKTNRALPHIEVFSRLRGLPRRTLFIFGTGCGLIVIVLLISRNQMRRYEEPKQRSEFLSPIPPAGFEVPVGGMPGQNSRYHSEVYVPAGYGLTITAVLCSNQVVLKSGFPAMILMAPSGPTVQGNLTWTLLGDTSFADGAPLQLALSLPSESDRNQKSIHITPPEPVNIDWAGEPARVWPPQNGHSKFLLIKGKASNTGTDNPEPAEWAVGVETRLDPLPPDVLRNLREPATTLGTNGLAGETVSSSLPPKTPPAKEVPDEAAAVESQENDP